MNLDGNRLQNSCSDHALSAPSVWDYNYCVCVGGSHIVYLCVCVCVCASMCVCIYVC